MDITRLFQEGLTYNNVVMAVEKKMDFRFNLKTGIM